jgi:hypothetical protein
MTKSDLQRVLKRLPELTGYGIGAYDWRNKTEDQRRDEIAAEQKEMTERIGDLNAVCDWLKGISIRLVKPNPSADSYHLKHLMEGQTGRYVDNGTFIAAAVHSGFMFKIERPNACFNIGRRELKRLRAMARRS